MGLRDEIGSYNPKHAADYARAVKQMEALGWYKQDNWDEDEQSTKVPEQDAKMREWLEAKPIRPLTARDRKVARKQAERLVAETERRLFGRRVS